MPTFILREYSGTFVTEKTSLDGDPELAKEYTTIRRARSAAKRIITKHGVAINIWRDYGSAAAQIVDTIAPSESSQ